MPLNWKRRPPTPEIVRYPNQDEKAYLRALGEQAMKDFKPQRIKTRVSLHCKSCGHQGVATVFLPAKFKCRKCGNRNPLVRT